MNFSTFQLKSVLFIAVMVYAAVIDIRSRIVPTHIHFLLLLIGFIDVSWSSISGAVIMFLPFLISGLLASLGGGDIKLAAGIGWVMGTRGPAAALIGLLAALFYISLFCIIKHQPIKSTSYPLVPFLAVGCIITTFIFI